MAAVPLSLDTCVYHFRCRGPEVIVFSRTPANPSKCLCRAFGELEYREHHVRDLQSFWNQIFTDQDVLATVRPIKQILNSAKIAERIRLIRYNDRYYDRYQCNMRVIDHSKRYPTSLNQSAIVYSSAQQKLSPPVWLGPLIDPGMNLRKTECPRNWQTSSLNTTTIIITAHAWRF